MRVVGETRANNKTKKGRSSGDDKAEKFNDEIAFLAGRMTNPWMTMAGKSSEQILSKQE